MSRRPRTPEHWPRMKYRAAGRHRRRAQELTCTFAEFVRDFSAAFGFLLAPWQEYVLSVREALTEVGLVFQRALAPAPPAPLRGASASLVIYDELAPVTDLLTLRCMAAEHDHCEGDFCECACHDIPTPTTDH